MISDEDRVLVLKTYAVGILTRAHAMELLEMEWYGDLRVAMNDAGLSIELPKEVQESMRNSINEAFDRRES